MLYIKFSINNTNTSLPKCSLKKESKNMGPFILQTITPSTIKTILNEKLTSPFLTSLQHPTTPYRFSLLSKKPLIILTPSKKPLYHLSNNKYNTLLFASFYTINH